MKALLACVALSLALHAGGAVWLARQDVTGAGGGAETPDARARIAMPAAAAVAQLVETWETPPEAASLAPETIRAADETPAPEVPKAVALFGPDARPDSPETAWPDAPAEKPALLPPAALPVVASQAPDLASQRADPVAPKVETVEAPRLPTRPEPLTPSVTPDDRLARLSATPPDPDGPEITAIPRPDPRPARPAPVPAQVARAEPPSTPAVAAAPSAARVTAAPQVDPGAREAWSSRIRQTLARHHRVPDAVLRRGLSGRVVLRVTVMPDGAVAGLAIRASSGHDLLDQAALATLRRAGRLPRAPEGVDKAMTFDVPLSFRTG